MSSHPRVSRLCRVSLWGILAVLGPVTAVADTVILKDGTVFMGVVTHDGDDGVAIRSGGNDWAFLKSEVASVRTEHATRAYERPVASRQQGKRKSVAVDTKAADAKASDAHVVLYGTSWCGFCQRARRYFREHQIPFVDRDVERDADAEEEVSRKCSQAGSQFTGGVPVIELVNERMASCPSSPCNPSLCKAVTAAAGPQV